MCSALQMGDVTAEEQEPEPLPSKVKDGRSERRKGGGDGVRPSGVGLCAGSVVGGGGGYKFGVELRSRLRMRSYRLVVCIDVPRLALPCPARLGSALLVKAGLLHTMQTGRGTVEYGRLLLGWICACAPVSQPTVLLSAEQVRDTAATARTSGRLKGAGTWGAGAQVEPRPTLHEGVARKVLGCSPEQASILKPSGGGASALAFLAPLHLCWAGASLF